jgi:hypothetical protein
MCVCVRGGVAVAVAVAFLQLVIGPAAACVCFHGLRRYILSRPDRNEHSFGAVFDAYAQADRLDLAMSTWDRLAGQGVDIGPIGSSALIKACARQMDLNTAKQVGGGEASGARGKGRGWG